MVWRQVEEGLGAREEERDGITKGGGRGMEKRREDGGSSFGAYSFNSLNKPLADYKK
jgi:hypothetical protein